MNTLIFICIQFPIQHPNGFEEFKIYFLFGIDVICFCAHFFFFIFHKSRDLDDNLKPKNHQDLHSIYFSKEKKLREKYEKFEKKEKKMPKIKKFEL